MQIPEDMKAIPIVCFDNGRRTILPFEEVYRLFWLVTLGWVLLSDFVRTGFGKQARQGSISKVVYGSAIRFVFNLLTHGRLVLAREDICLLDEHDDPPSPQLFPVWAYRFGKLFNGSRPCEHVSFTDPRGHRHCGYRMKPGQTWLVVVEVDPDSRFGNEDVDWTIFETPPDRLENSAT